MKAPKKSKQKKSEFFQFRISTKEKQKLKEKAKRLNMSAAKYIIFNTIGKEEKANVK